jgi:hypothetical protein
LSKKSKYGRGTRHPEHWLFGGVERLSGKWFGILTGTDRTKPTLSALIAKHIRPGTLIMSDKFGSYVSSNEAHTLANNPVLRQMEYAHQWVNHSENFVDPTTGAHTQTIEGVWEVRLKQYIKVKRGMKHELLPSFIDEALWRSWFFPRGATSAQYFKGFVAAIKKHYL